MCYNEVSLYLHLEREGWRWEGGGVLEKKSSHYRVPSESVQQSFDQRVPKSSTKSQGWVSVFYALLPPSPPSGNILSVAGVWEALLGLGLCDAMGRLDHITQMQTLYEGPR